MGIKDYTTPEHKTCRGFTLTELLVVIAVITVVGGLGGGMYWGSYRRMQVAQAARDLYLMAYYTRIAAIELQQAHTLQMDRKNGRCWVTTSRRDTQTLNMIQAVVSNPFCRPLTFAQDVQFEQISVDRHQGSEIPDAQDTIDAVTFYADGTADAAVVQLGDNQTHYTLRINASTAKASLVKGQARDTANATIDLDADDK